MPDLMDDDRHARDIDAAADVMIDAALEELRAIEPAPDFLPRLRAHVERAAPPAWWRWRAPAAAVAVALLAAFAIGRELGLRETPPAVVRITERVEPAQEITPPVPMPAPHVEHVPRPRRARTS